MDRGISMEQIINVTEGDKPSDKHGCFFCEKDAPFLFGVIDSKNSVKTHKGEEGYVMNSVALCEQHAEGFNSLLSGKHDINELITVMKSSRQKKINLRR